MKINHTTLKSYKEKYQSSTSQIVQYQTCLDHIFNKLLYHNKN